MSSSGIRRVGRYVLCDQVGAGGMATIHIARLQGPRGFARTVAAKQLHPHFAQNPQFVAMFLDEARLAGRIRHGNVVSPFDIVTTESDLFIIMDYVNGESLAALSRAHGGPLSPPIASAIFVQVLLGLHAVHAATSEHGESLELVHRDASPQNILIGQDGVARVIDFGIAKAAARSQVTEEGKLKGKIGYMAPEQLRQDPIDARADLFTIGIVLWEALTGARLFAADTLAASVELILRGKLQAPSSVNPAVGPELDAIVMRALAREPKERWEDAKSMAAALERVVAPASTLELVKWVEQLALPEFERRAELVRRAEAINLEDAIIPGPDSVNDSEQSTPGARGPSKPATAIGVFGERAYRVSFPGGRARWIMVVGPVLAGALALIGLPRLRGVSQKVEAPAIQEASVTAIPGAFLVQEASAAASPLEPEPEPELEPEPEPGTSPLPAAPANGSVSAPRPHAQATARAKRPRVAKDNCNPPWTIEGDIKQFKTECLREAH